MDLSSSITDQWDSEHRGCTVVPIMALPYDRARFVMARHAGHGPGCRQFQAAMATASTVVG